MFCPAPWPTVCKPYGSWHHAEAGHYAQWGNITSGPARAAAYYANKGAPVNALSIDVENGNHNLSMSVSTPAAARQSVAAGYSIQLTYRRSGPLDAFGEFLTETSFALRTACPQ